MSESVQLHVGSYAKSGGCGLYPLTLEPDGTLRPGEPFGGIANASFAAADSASGLHYLVDEEAGELGVWQPSAEGWRAAGRVGTGGEQPCYVALDPARRKLAVANYGSGSVALFALDDEGKPDGPPSLYAHRGGGPVADRQDGPHAHCVRFAADGSALYLVDLGADEIVRLDIAEDGAFAAPQTAYRAPPGSGPRHLLFHPRQPLAVLVSELASTLTVLQTADGRLEKIARHSLVPAGFAGETLGGHLALTSDGARAYATNRGHDSIALFALSPDGGAEPVGHVASGGAGPRHLLLLEDLGLLVVAHEDDGRVTAFRLGADGLPDPAGQGATVPGACFVLRTPELMRPRSRA